MERLERARRRLDRTDREILDLLTRRLGTVREVAVLKAGGLPFLRDHERERELLDRIEGWARELALDPYRVREIFREIIAMSLKEQEEALLARQRAERTSEQANRVTYQGVPGSYSHLAARKFFGAHAAAMETAGLPTFAQALAAVERGEAGYAVLPIENTTAGSINETYDLLRRTELSIVGEEIVPVLHCLLALPDTGLPQIKRVFSHPQALTQCSRYLASLPGAEILAFVDTAAAAEKVCDDGDPAQAAVAGEEAGRLYGLTPLARNIADQPENWTRFVVVSGEIIRPDPRIPSKTSLVFSTRHHRGALAQALGLLSGHGINLCKLESRPVPHRPWEYMFYADVEGSIADDTVTVAIAELRRECPYLRVLGSYPARTTDDARRDREDEGAPAGFRNR